MLTALNRRQFNLALINARKGVFCCPDSFMVHQAMPLSGHWKFVLKVKIMVLNNIANWLVNNGELCWAYHSYRIITSDGPNFLHAYVDMTDGKVPNPKLIGIHYSGEGGKENSWIVMLFHIRGNRVTRITRENPEREYTGDPLALEFAEMIWQKFMMDKGISKGRRRNLVNKQVSSAKLRKKELHKS